MDRMIFNLFPILTLLLAACSNLITSLQAASPQPASPEALIFPTRGPLPTLAATLIPSASPTPPPIHAPQPTMTLPDGLVTVEHPRAHFYIFAVDPKAWNITIEPNHPDPNVHYALLGHKTMRRCRIDIVPPLGPPPPDKLYVQQIGRFGWQVSDYTNTAMLHFKELYLYLDNFANPECHAAQEEVLASMLHGSEYYGGPTLTPSAPRNPPPLTGFKCPKALAPRLRPSDVAYIIADSITLRHTPAFTEGSKYRAWPKHAPVVVQINGNPICVDKQYVFWKVTVSEMGEGGQEYEGWMAESSPEEYYLENLDPGW